MQHPIRNPIWSVFGKYFLDFGLLFVMGVIGAIALTFAAHLPIQAQTSGIPEVVNSCIPSNQVARSELIGSTRLQDRDYYLLTAYEQGDDVASDLVIAASGESCERIFYNPMGDRLALSSTVPQAVARQLTLQRYQREIQRIGQQAFQQQVNQAASSGSVTWYDEEVWALQQLGITVPANVRVNQ
jgi:hypothetical protein